MALAELPYCSIIIANQKVLWQKYGIVNGDSTGGRGI
jgi:hypothetical protein